MSELRLSRFFITTNPEHYLFQKSPMIEMWEELGSSKARIFSDANWICSMLPIVYFCWMLLGPLYLWWICFPDWLIMRGKSEKPTTSSVHFYYPRCHYHESLWGLEVHSCLESKKWRSCSLECKGGPGAPQLTSPPDLPTKFCYPEMWTCRRSLAKLTEIFTW